MSPYHSKVQIPEISVSSKAGIKSGQSSNRSILKSGRVNSNNLRKSKNKPKPSKPQVYHNIVEDTNRGGKSQRVGSMDSLEENDESN